MAESTRGNLDTSAVIELGEIDPRLLPDACMAASSPPCGLRAGLPARLADLHFASTAAANGLALYTRNPADFSGLGQLVAVKAV